MIKVNMSRYRYAPLLVFQIILMVLFFVFASYGGEKDAAIRGFEDTHVMIFIGFAYLMTFLKRYCYSATGYNLFLAALAIQWSLLCQSFCHMKNNEIFITKKSLLEADIMSATVLITFGALLGLASGTQLLVIAIVEAAVGSVNIYISEEILQISDIGGSICIHTFGAYFGLAVSAAMRMKKPPPEPASGSGVVPIPFQAPKQVVRLDGPNYTSDVTAMIGSLFLWIYWPSFNSGLTKTPAEYQRAVVNTYLSLASCTVTSFVLSAAVSHKPGKLDMVHIQNSPLAGGVGVGAVANLYIGPGAAIAVGIGAAFISVFGYRYLTPKLEKYGIQDTCGVNNLHGMPGIYSALLSALFAFLATAQKYGTELANIFPATYSLPAVILNPVDGEEAGGGGAGPAVELRSMEMQAVYQLISLAVTLGLSIGAGLITGFIVKTKTFSPLEVKKRYDDEENWELP